MCLFYSTALLQGKGCLNMNTNSSLYNSIDSLNDSEIVERIKGNYYTEEALLVAKEILSQRGVPIPMIEEGYVKQTTSFRQSHPFWYWIFVATICSAILRFLSEPLKQLLNSLF